MKLFILPFILTFTLLFSIQHDEVNRKSIIGEWNFKSFRTVVDYGNGKYAVKESGSMEDLKVEFNDDNKVLLKSINGKVDSLSFIERGREIELTYAGKNSYYKSFEGRIKIIFNRKQNLLQVQLKKNKSFSIFLER
jgi:hypothetical protein